MSILLEVSIGEALDKLSILDIKMDKIKDKRREEIIKEYDYLLSLVHDKIERFRYYYDMLKKTNLEIWDLQDYLRDNKTIDMQEYNTICKKVFTLNDYRYANKKKLNELCESKFKEQKGFEVQNL